jgi:hypothetical protein
MPQLQDRRNIGDLANGMDADQAERQKLTAFPSMKSSVQAAEASIFTFSTGQIHQTENGLYVVVIW